jgi:hypothetical protein
MTARTIRPIETWYRGYRFRSRLEARWAVFLDAAAIEWDYEQEGFRVEGKYYLPDFWLPHNKAFLEIKPGDDWIEIRSELAPLLSALADTSAMDVFLIQGAPCPEDPGDIYVGFVPHIVSFAPQKGICSARLFECPFCGRCAFRRMDSGAWNMWCQCHGGRTNVFDDANYNPFELSPRIRHAMQAARQARFGWARSRACLSHYSISPPRIGGCCGA